MIYPSNKEGTTIDDVYNLYLTGKLGLNGNDVDILSIDIDGRDYEIFEKMQIQPKLIIIEGGFSWDPKLQTKIPYNIAWNNLQQPLYVMFQLAREKGYEPICFNQDSFLIRKDLYDNNMFFKNIQNDPITLWYNAYNNDLIIQENDRIWLNNMRQNCELIRLYESN